MTDLEQNYSLYKSTGYSVAISALEKEEKELSERKHIIQVLHIVDAFGEMLKNKDFPSELKSITLRIDRVGPESWIEFIFKTQNNDSVSMDDKKYKVLIRDLSNLLAVFTNSTYLFSADLNTYSGIELPLKLESLNDYKKAFLRPDLQIMLEQMLLNNSVEWVAQAALDNETNETPRDKRKAKI